MKNWCFAIVEFRDCCAQNISVLLTMLQPAIVNESNSLQCPFRLNYWNISALQHNTTHFVLSSSLCLCLHRGRKLTKIQQQKDNQNGNNRYGHWWLHNKNNNANKQSKTQTELCDHSDFHNFWSYSMLPESIVL